MPRIVYRNFTGGEVTPTLSSRYDLQKFGSFLQCCENFIPNLHGDVERRPGTRFIADLGEECVLLPFSFNTEQENNYVLIFGANTIRVADENGLISGATMTNPYSLSDVYKLSFSQVADVLYIAHKNYALRKITRSGTGPWYTWTISNVSLNMTLSPPTTPSVQWIKGDGDDKADTYQLQYKVTAVDANGVESIASNIGSVTGKYPTDWVSGSYVKLSWTGVAGAAEYNVYRESAGYFGFIGTVQGEKGAISKVYVNGSILEPSAYLAGEIVVTINKDTAFPNSCLESGMSIPSNTVSDLKVYARSGQRAYTYNGKTYVYVTKKTVTNRYACFAFLNIKEIKETTTSYEYFWVQLPSSNTGTYTSSQYRAGALGSDSGGPEGSIDGLNFVGIHGGTAGSTKTYTFTDQNFEPDTSTTPKENWDPFANGNHPATVCFFQQRMCLGGTRDNPAAFYMSRTGDYESFRKSSPLQDDDPVEYMLASGAIDDVKWLVPFGDLLIGTSGAEFKATSSGSAITSSDVQITSQSYWGSADLQPIVIGQSILHCQRAGHHVRDLYYSWESDGYSGTDLSVLAPQEVELTSLKQWCNQQSSGTNVWIVRSDGVLLCLTYMKEQNVFAWSRHTTDGNVLSIASINSGDNGDTVMMVVERTINGTKKYYLERLEKRFLDETPISSAWFVDCGKEVYSSYATTVFKGFDHLKGKQVAVLAEGAPLELTTVNSQGAIEVPYPVKKVIVGLNYKSCLSPLPVETDLQTGSSLGKRRAYGKCILRLHNSVCGKYAATEQGDLFNVDAWKARTQYDIPFLPAAYGEPVEPFSGDIEITLPSGQDTDSSIYIIQDRPLPFRLVSVMMDVDFGEE